LVLFFPLVTFGFDRYPAIRDISYYSPVGILLACLYLLLSETFGGVKPRGSFSVLHIRDEVLQALKARNLWIYWGGLAVTLTCTMDRIPWLGIIVPALGNLGLAIYLYFLKDVVLQHRLLTPRRTFGKIFSDLITALAAVTVFIGMTAWVRDNQFLFVLNTVLAAYIVVVSSNPIRRLAFLFFEKIFFKEATRIKELTSIASRAMAGAFHEKAIAAATGGFLQTAIGTPMKAFYSLDAEQRHYRLISNDGADKLPDFLPISFPLISHWKKSKVWRPLLESELKLESERTTFFSRPSQLQAQLESLRGLQSTIAIPFISEKKVLGFVTVDAHDPPDIWEESWGVLTLLQPFCERVVEALRELDVYSAIRERDRLATLGEMAAGLAHEIRNPLGAIKGAVQVLDPKPKDADAPFLKIIVEEVNRLNHVVTQFLDYARPFRAEFRVVDLRKIIQAGIERFCRQNAGLIDVSLAGGQDLVGVYCQPELLGQVLHNLLENAKNASLAKGGKDRSQIVVELREHMRESGSDIVLSVKDQGIGIATENLDKVLIPFFTLSSKGTGLGLSVSQRIAEAHGGRLEVDSIFNQGTVVSLRMPWRKGEL
jgi:signal transduction histidine kinase